MYQMAIITLLPASTKIDRHPYYIYLEPDVCRCRSYHDSYHKSTKAGISHRLTSKHCLMPLPEKLKARPWMKESTCPRRSVICHASPAFCTNQDNSGHANGLSSQLFSKLHALKIPTAGHYYVYMPGIHSSQSRIPRNKLAHKSIHIYVRKAQTFTF